MHFMVNIYTWDTCSQWRLSGGRIWCVGRMHGRYLWWKWQTISSTVLQESRQSRKMSPQTIWNEKVHHGALHTWYLELYWFWRMIIYSSSAVPLRMTHCIALGENRKLFALASLLWLSKWLESTNPHTLHHTITQVAKSPFACNLPNRNSVLPHRLLLLAFIVCLLYQFLCIFTLSLVVLSFNSASIYAACNSFTQNKSRKKKKRKTKNSNRTRYYLQRMKRVYSMIPIVMQLFRIRHGVRAYQSVRIPTTKWAYAKENWNIIRASRSKSAA